MRTALKLSAALLLSVAGQASAQVQHGLLNVVEINGGNTAASVQVSRVGGYGSWSILLANCSRADYCLNFGHSNDSTIGVFLTGPAQTQRTEPSVPNEYFATTGTTLNGGRCYATTFEAPTGAEVNFNTAITYFPNTDGWLAASVHNSGTGTPLTTLIGNQSIQLRDQNSVTGSGIELIDDTTTAGEYRLRASGIDFRRQGVLLACSAENTPDRVGVRLNDDGSAIIHCMSNTTEFGGANEAVAFAFIPAGTQGVTMATISGSGRPLFRQGNFNVTVEPGATGTYRLSITGESPATGTLMVTPCTEMSGASFDNVIFARPEGNDWIITVRDTEPLPGGMTLETQDYNGLVFNFAFFKNDIAIVPATPPSITQRLNDVVASRFHVTEITPGNGLGNMRADRIAGSDALDAFADNRGDIGICWLGARSPAARDGALDAVEGILLGSCSEHVRDNSATGGITGWSTLGNENNEFRIHQVGTTATEMNSDFNAVFFPNSAGFLQGADIGAINGLASVPIAGNASTDGVLMALNWDNSNRVVAAVPNGSGFDVTMYEGGNGNVATSSAEFGYVYLPYSTPNLIAGRVTASGAIVSGTGFTANTTNLNGLNMVRILIPGVDARTDGVFLVTGTGPQAVSWMPGPTVGGFLIAGEDLVTHSMGRTAFSFAYIPYEGLGVIPCPPDFNDDGSLNSQDFFDFIIAFFASDPSADYNHDGSTTSQDFFDFIAAYFTGCD